MEKASAINKTIVITGASSGAGWAMAVEFARYGAQLVLAARRTESLESVAAECRELGATVWTVKTDTGNGNAMTALATAAIEYAGSIDVWINNAGVLAAGAVEEIPSEVNEAVIRTNLIGYVHGARAVLPYFKAQEYGLLINNISIGAWLPTPYMAAYSASKFGLEGFTQALRGELRNYPEIHVCNLYPGFLDTPGMQHSANYTGKQLTPSPPLTDPREVARAVVSLLENPRETTTVGFFPHLMRMAFRTAPVLTRTTVGALISTYLKNAPDSSMTSGNVLDPVPFGTGPDGGWRKNSLKPVWHTSRMILGVVAGFVVISLVKRLS